MVFTFEHVSLDSQPGGRKWDLHPLTLPVLKQNLNEWQIGLADAGWNSLYWDNHDQPRAVSRFGDDSPEHRVNSAKTLATVQHMHKGTPYVYQGEELGMTNTYYSYDRAVPGHRVGELPRGRDEPRARGRDRAALALGEEPGQRPLADAVGRPVRTPASPKASPGCR